MGNSSELDDHIKRKYEIKRRIGKGAYGIVWKAVHRKTNQTVAIKKIFDAFHNETDAQRTFREIMFLKEFRHHDNIVRLLAIHRASNDEDIYLIFEYMESDLHKLISKVGLLGDLHKRFIMYQLLRATYYIHSGNVIHRDQKPSNILVDSACRCKMADFGLARSLTVSSSKASSGSESDPEPALTDYVATRWYRAPEILVASQQYTKGIDMWSLGCILAEMLLGRPLFPGSSTVNQVERIMSAIDPPSAADLNSVSECFGSTLLSRAPLRPRVPLSEILSGAGAPPDAVDLVTHLLVLNPHKRLTAAQALSHPYVSRYWWNPKEPKLGRSVVPILCDDVQLTAAEYRDKLYELIRSRDAHRVSSCVRSTTSATDPAQRHSHVHRSSQSPVPKVGSGRPSTAVENGGPVPTTSAIKQQRCHNSNSRAPNPKPTRSLPGPLGGVGVSTLDSAAAAGTACTACTAVNQSATRLKAGGGGGGGIRGGFSAGDGSPPLVLPGQSAHRHRMLTTAVINGSSQRGFVSCPGQREKSSIRVCQATNVPGARTKLH